MHKILLYLLVLINVAQASTVIDKQSVDIHIKQASIYIEKNSNNSDILQKKFKKITLPQALGRHKDDVIWMKFTFINKLESNVSLKLRQKFAHRYDIFIYELNNGVLSQKEYFNRNDKDHNFKSLSTLFSFALKTGEEKTYIYKLMSKAPALIDFYLESEENSKIHSQKEVSYFSLFFGSLTALFIYHLILLITLRKKVYFLYSCVLFFTGFYLVGISNFSMILFEHSVAFSILPFAPMFLTLFLIYFLRNMLETSENLPKIDRLLTYYLRFIYTVIVFFLIAGIGAYIPLVAMILLLTSLLLLVISIYAVRQNILLSKMFLLASFSHFIGIFVAALVALGLFPLNSISMYINFAGILIEVVLFAFLLAYRISFAQDLVYYYDGLTGLENIFRCREVIEVDDENYLFMIDISSFSEINRSYGKVNADLVLKETALYLEKNITDAMKLYKADSDRFIIYIRGYSEEKVENYCKALFNSFDMFILAVEEDEINLSINVGIAAVEDKESAFVNVEFALTQSKRAGSKQYTFFNSVHEKELEQMHMKNILITKSLFKAGSFVPYFQAIKNVKLDKVDKYEVLVRGIYREEIISPNVFLEPAKQLGLLTTITTMMIKKSFPFFENNNFEFSINLSGDDLRNDSFVPYLKMRLKASKIEASRLTFEILETVKIESEPIIQRTIKEIKALGCKIAVDDFGVERSNFLRLLELDFDILKLDGSFIKKLTTSSDSVKVVKAIVSLAQTMDIVTVAEYVETKEIYNLLADIGIDYAQGYYVSRAEAELLILEE